MIAREKIAILTPIYNEAKFLPEFLPRLTKQGLYVLAVDDGSTDGSLEIVRARGVEYISVSKNAGKGNALRLGFTRLIELGYEWIIVMDSDLQHLPEEVPLFIEKAGSGASYGIVNGTRMRHPKGMPPVRFLTNHFMSLVLSAVAGQWISDTQCGYKMISVDLIRHACLQTGHFEIEDELLLEAARLKVKIGFVPVTTVYGSEVSHINPVTDTIRFIRFLARRLRKRMKGEPPCS